MQRELLSFYSPALSRNMDVISYGHKGTPIIAFPSDGGSIHDMENNEVITSLKPQIDGGRIKIYCTESIDDETWLNSETDPHMQTVRYNHYQDYLVNNLVTGIRKKFHDDESRIGLLGCSMGGLHAANCALKFPNIFHYALCISGKYDLYRITGKSHSQDAYFNNPIAYAPHLHGQSLNYVRNTHITMVCGQSIYEQKCLDDTNRLANILLDKCVSHERDIWDKDMQPDWSKWREMIIHHIGKAFG